MLRLIATRRTTSALKQSVCRYTTSLQPTAKEVAPAVAQSPNRATTWSRDQRPKHEAMRGPRFEQMNLAAQVNKLNLLQLIIFF